MTEEETKLNAVRLRVFCLWGKLCQKLSPTNTFSEILHFLTSLLSPSFVMPFKKDTHAGDIAKGLIECSYEIALYAEQYMLGVISMKE